MTRRRTIATAAILVGALGLTACGTNREEGSGTGGAAGGSTCDTSKGTLVVGMVAPLSGGLSSLGLGMSHSAGLAVDQANAKCAVPGYKLAFQAEDDQATPQVASRALTNELMCPARRARSGASPACAADRSSSPPAASSHVR